MLVVYYSRGCDSLELFDNLKISETELYQKHLNQHNVIHLNMQSFLSKTKSVEKMIELLIRLLVREHIILSLDYYTIFLFINHLYFMLITTFVS